uniref:protein phosphatase 1 regulatory subunit 32 isoform X2 n=1 Tax=Scatophagus argus TaxID=75038 RepID=UPI001ED82C59|nr:protein phosphatase 1 regulatory subunit 32 isoform X2 [Scatophagus argus]
MAEQRRTVMSTVGATGSRGRLASNTGKLYNTSCGGTGFTANQRPAIYYKPSLDHTDNPHFGLLLSDSFVSQTQRDYQPHIRSDCSGSLPNIVSKPRASGFHQLRSHQTTVTEEGKTEYRNAFVPHHLTPAVSHNHVTVGPKGESGFTEGAELQLNTFQERKQCPVEPHQTHSSVMKSDFTPPSILQGTEDRPGVCSRSSRETGFTRGAVAPLACPSSLLPSPQSNSNAPTQITIGKKPTGFVLNAPNNQVFPITPFDGSHFTTHYKSMFCHRADFEKVKSVGIISTKMDSGYNRRDLDRFILKG